MRLPRAPEPPLPDIMMPPCRPRSRWAVAAGPPATKTPRRRRYPEPLADRDQEEGEGQDAQGEIVEIVEQALRRGRTSEAGWSGLGGDSKCFPARRPGKEGGERADNGQGLEVGGACRGRGGDRRAVWRIRGGAGAGSGSERQPSTFSGHSGSIVQRSLLRAVSRAARARREGVKREPGGLLLSIRSVPALLQPTRPRCGGQLDGG